MTHTEQIASGPTAEQRVAARAARLLDTDDEIRSSAPDPVVAESLASIGPDLPALVDKVMVEYADRPALRRRSHEITLSDDGRRVRRLLTRTESTTYSRLYADAKDLARALTAVHPGSFVATLGFAGPDYVVAELATIFAGAVAVPLQSGASTRQLVDICTEAAPVAVAVDHDNLDAALEIARKCPSIRHLIVLDHDDAVDDEADSFARARGALADSSIVFETLDAAVVRGRQEPPRDSVPTAGPDDIATLVYTSGSTGTPKGAIHTQRIASRLWAPSMWFDVPADSSGAPAVVSLDYLPMSHLAGRAVVFSTLASGGIVHFAGASDLSTLLEDFEIARPTVALLVPRVCDLLRQTAIGRIDSAAHRTGRTSAEVREEVMAEMRDSTLGGRVLAAAVGTAPTSDEVVEFVSELLDAPISDNYGSTEAGMVLFDGVVQRPPVIDYRLEDVPELGYLTSDSPHPRGELLLRTDALTPGYYKRPDATADSLTDDGYYRTGDVFAEIAPDRLVYVDRRKNVVKLAQGEFVALSRLEAIYAAADGVDQIFVHGSGQRSYLLAVVVPTAGTDKESVLGSLRRRAKDEELESYEVPRDVIVADEPFTRANGLLSGANKQLRPALAARYGDALEERYRRIDEGQTESVAELRRLGPDAPVLETVGNAAAALLGCAGTEIGADVRFTDLGGDSLSALSFSTLLQDIFGVDVPVSTIIAPSSDLATIAARIDAQLHRSTESASTAAPATFASVHGTGADTIRAEDLRLELFVDVDSDPAPARADVRTVLLTGATGYLGRFLCLEWLQRMAPVGGTVVAVVRGRSADEARERLRASFDSGDAELLARFDELSAATLEVVPGDVGESHLGLDAATWESLCERVDRIVHPAALVNHALPYEQLFGPNVVGTGEVVRLAVTGHLKPVTYLSTVAVAAGVAQFEEDGDIREFSAQRAVDDSYANGYGNSKWAGEVVLRGAFDRFHLPVTVLRSDMILAHPTWAGQVNVPDIFTRTVLSVIATGTAPESFYRTDTGAPVDGHGRPRAHYDGLPADFTAAAVTALGPDADSGFRTYDLINPHDDGVSLDTVVDWIIESGVEIRRVADYDEWFDEFCRDLGQLPADARSRSVLPLRHAYAAPSVPTDGSDLPAEKFRDAVRSSAVPGYDDIPHVTRSLVQKYVRDLAHLGLSAGAITV